MASERTDELDRLKALLDKANLGFADVERVLGRLIAGCGIDCDGGCSNGCQSCSPGCSSGGKAKGELGGLVSYPEQLLRAVEEALRPFVRPTAARG
jgi:hypothetical protein